MAPYGRRAMDPDRFQMRDLKRRMAEVEKKLIYQSASMARFAGVLKETRGAIVGLDLFQKGFSPEQEELWQKVNEVIAWFESLVPFPPTQAPPAKDSPP